jgi:hypothetical protein
METKDLLPYLNNYQAQLQKIEKQRQYWQDQLKAQLQEILSEVAALDENTLELSLEETYTNLQSVGLGILTRDSGIIEQIERSSRAFPKYGGVLNFSQMYCGDVVIFITYPYIEGLVEEQEAKILQRLAPEAVDKDLILAQVQLFLDEMSAWETSAAISTTKKIGFYANANSSQEL